MGRAGADHARAGGQVAAALNLHHPYDPSNPVDSIQVAAPRAIINNIIGGVTVTGTSGRPAERDGRTRVRAYEAG